MKSSVVGTNAHSSFTSLAFSTPGLSLHRSSVLIKSQHIITYYNKIFKTALDIQTFLQYLYNALQLVKNKEQKP
jgi:hypothetical protein